MQRREIRRGGWNVVMAILAQTIRNVHIGRPFVDYLYEITYRKLFYFRYLAIRYNWGPTFFPATKIFLQVSNIAFLFVTLLDVKTEMIFSNSMKILIPGHWQSFPLIDNRKKWRINWKRLSFHKYRKLEVSGRQVAASYAPIPMISGINGSAVQ